MYNDICAEEIAVGEYQLCIKLAISRAFLVKTKVDGGGAYAIASKPRALA
jgi:hypothetical protein